MAIPLWRERQIAADRMAREQRAHERLGVLMAFDEPSHLPAVVCRVCGHPIEAGEPRYASEAGIVCWECRR